jgi:hypothetical protein
VSWAVYKDNPHKLHGCPLTGSSRLWDTFLGALHDLTDARAERRNAEKTGDVEQRHLDAIVAAESRLEEARREYLESCPKK